MELMQNNVIVCGILDYCPEFPLLLAIKFTPLANKACTVRLHREDAFAVKYLRLVLCVTPEHVCAAGLEIPGGNQDYIAVLDPGPSLHLASYAADSVGSV